MGIDIYNEDCIAGAKAKFKDSSVDLIICDPPFGIGELTFDKHYNRKEQTVIGGYQEAPHDYRAFSKQWVEQAVRILKPNGSMYLISGWNNLGSVIDAVDSAELQTINHIVWKYNFGVYTSKKFVSSHYHILYCAKKKAKRTFNTHSRYSKDDRAKSGRSILYRDLEDVWVINKQYQPGARKNKNKLPEALIEKMIAYSSNAGDLVVDFFMGNFTTAAVALRMNRKVGGFEVNEEAYNYWMPQLHDMDSKLKYESNNAFDSAFTAP